MTEKNGREDMFFNVMSTLLTESSNIRYFLRRRYGNRFVGASSQKNSVSGIVKIIEASGNSF